MADEAEIVTQQSALSNEGSASGVYEEEKPVYRIPGALGDTLEMFKANYEEKAAELKRLKKLEALRKEDRVTADLNADFYVRYANAVIIKDQEKVPDCLKIICPYPIDDPPRYTEEYREEVPMSPRIDGEEPPPPPPAPPAAAVVEDVEVE